jgi:hypothetical protein
MAIFIVTDINLAGYALWMIINILIFTIARKSGWKIFFLLLSILPYISILTSVITEPYPEIIKFMLTDRVKTNLFLTLLIYPSILSFTSFAYIRHHYHGVRVSIVIPSTTLSLSLSAIVTFLWVLNFNPYNRENPQPAEIQDVITKTENSQSRIIRISSPRKIGNAELLLDNRTYDLINIGRNTEIKTPVEKIPLKIKTSSRNFLGQKKINCTVSGSSAPVTVSIKLSSEKPFTLHEASYPFETSPSGKSAVIFTGENPPFPLYFRFTVNKSAKIKLQISAEWINPENPPVLNGKNLSNSVTRTTVYEITL